MPIFDLNSYIEQEVLSGRELDQIWQSVAQIAADTETKIVTPDAIPGPIRPRMFEGFGCDCGQLRCHVDPNGNVTPTGFLLDQLPLENLRHRSLKEIWDQGASFTLFRRFPRNEQCSQCEHYRSCRGGCRANAFLHSGDINLPDTNCAITQCFPVKKPAQN